MIKGRGETPGLFLFSFSTYTGTMQPTLLVANWKMNTTIADAHTIAVAVRNECEHVERAEVVLCPPAIWLSELSHIIPASLPHLHLGAQNIHQSENGPFTGEVSALQVRELAEFVIIGHSERRKHFHESSEQVEEKMHMALATGLTPIVCVGENEKTSDPTRLLREIEYLLHALPAERQTSVVLAYEPVWAISAQGNGAASPAHVQSILRSIRAAFPSLTRVIYGGSVTADIASAFLALPELSGLLVGSASLKIADFLRLCHIVEHRHAYA
jgi:triosephosphate isomerase (TIM)